MGRSEIVSCGDKVVMGAVTVQYKYTQYRA
jgi:hypothetical protein